MKTYRTVALPVQNPAFALSCLNSRTIESPLYRKPSCSKRPFFLCLSLATLFTCASAHAVVGGTPSAMPWVVQLVALDNQNVSVCVGAAINDHTIITATHCKADAASFADRNVLIERRHDIEGTRTTLLFLKAPYSLPEYAKLGPNYFNTGSTVPKGTVGTAYGYDSSNFFQQQRVRLEVNFHGKSADTPEVFTMTQLGDGTLHPGDSGAPLVINGFLVATLRGPGKLPVGPDTHYIFVGLSPALDRIAQLVYQRKALQFVASEL
jgi:hypothetical protein